MFFCLQGSGYGAHGAHDAYGAHGDYGAHGAHDAHEVHRMMGTKKGAPACFSVARSARRALPTLRVGLARNVSCCRGARPVRAVGLVLGAPFPLGIFTIRDAESVVNTLFHFFYCPGEEKKTTYKGKKKGIIGGKSPYDGQLNRFIGVCCVVVKGGEQISKSFVKQFF